MQYHKPIELKTASLIQACALELLVGWDERGYQRIFRMPMEGEVFDAVSEELASMELRIGMWSIFARGKGNTQRIHVDAASTTEKVHSAIIVPVLGVEGSKFQWFKDADILRNIPTPDGLTTFFKPFYSKPPSLVDELEILTPTIVRVDAPHRAIATAESPRAIVSIKLAGNPELLCFE